MTRMCPNGGSAVRIVSFIDELHCLMSRCIYTLDPLPSLALTHHISKTGTATNHDQPDDAKCNDLFVPELIAVRPLIVGANKCCIRCNHIILCILTLSIPRQSIGQRITGSKGPPVPTADVLIQIESSSVEIETVIILQRGAIIAALRVILNECFICLGQVRRRLRLSPSPLARPPHIEVVSAITSYSDDFFRRLSGRGSCGWRGSG